MNFQNTFSTLVERVFNKMNSLEDTETNDVINLNKVKFSPRPNDTKHSQF